MKSLPLTNGRALQGIELLTAKYHWTLKEETEIFHIPESKINTPKMKPTQIVDRSLSKPWLLIAVYENLFDRITDLKWQYNSASYHYKAYGGEHTRVRVNMLKSAIDECARALRDWDAQIHNYIVNHNKPQQIKQIA